MNNRIGDIMNGSISAILIAIGYIVLWCDVTCLIMSTTGMADDATSIRWCGVMCLFVAAILMGSGVGWYYIVKPKD